MPTPQMPLQTPMTDKQGKIVPIWMRHFLALTNLIAAGTTKFAPLPIYANNAAAKAAGLTIGEAYMTSTGSVQAVY